MKELKHGVYVRIETDKGVFEGMVVERPELLEKNVLVLKLKSGYNLGILKENIKSYKILSEKKGQKEEFEIKKNPSLKQVDFISTGGTISSKVDYSTGGVSAKYDARFFVQLFPELQKIANINPVPLMNKMSENLLPEDWINIAKSVHKSLKKAEGVVVTHGTDTMHYTAAALSFFLRDLSKPVVLTGSQRSIDRGSTDARLNLICSTYAGLSDMAEVGIVFHATSNDNFCYFHRGTKVRKMHTSRRDAFRSINALPIAKIYGNGKIEKLSNYRKRSDTETKLDARFEEKVGMLFVHPNMDPELIDFFIERKYRGLVLQATALGHIPTNNKKEIFSRVKNAIENGMAVVIATQTLYGRVHESVYSNLRRLSKVGAIFVKDMLSETAYVKLGWVLAKYRDLNDVKAEMLKNYAGEFDHSNFNAFLN